jgi:hypothetical protein
MATESALDAARQVLVNLGNRYVVFAPSPGLPQSPRFDPEKDALILPRVADESEVVESRVVESLRVSGMTRSIPTDISTADIELVDENGNHILADIKIRERDPKQRDFHEGHQRLQTAAKKGQKLEIWYLNTERLKITIMSGVGHHLQVQELTPIDVWEKTDEGVYNRAHVIEEVDDWVHRIDALYEDVCAWLNDKPNLRFDRSRSVVMSEELMQKFAVTDRELSVLDIIDGDQVVASFVPRGLWLIGSWGRIDIITRDQTRILDRLRTNGKLEWRLVSSESRRRTEPFDKSALLATLKI